MPGAPRVIVAGATGFAGALAAHLLWRHPQFELSAVTGALRARPGGWRSCTRAIACRWRSRRSSPSASPASTRRSSPTRTRPPRPTVAELRALGARVVDLSADFRLRSLAAYEQWYGEHPRPRAARRGGLRADRAAPRGDRRGRDRREPRLLPDRLAARARAARSRGADRRRGDRRQAGDLRCGARVRRDARTCRWPARTSFPTRSPRTGTRRRSRSSSPCSAPRPGSVQFQAAPRAARPGRDGELLRHADAARRRGGAARAVRRRLRRGAVRRGRRCAARRARGAQTNFCRLFAASDEHTGKVLVFSAIDNLWKGTSSQAVQNLNLMFGLPETSGLDERGPPFFRSRWVPAPAHVRELAPDSRAARGLPRGGRRGRHQAERQPRRRRCSCATRAADERGPLHRDRHAGRARARHPRALAAGRAARSCSPTPAVPTRRPDSAGSTTPPRPRVRPRWRCGRRARRGRARLDRRDQPPAARRQRAEGHPRGARAARARRRRGVPAGDPDDRRVREAREPRGRAAVGHGAAERPVQGRGHDLAELRDDAVLRARPTPRSTPRPPTCCSAFASSAPSTARRSTGSCRPTTPRS